jgi:tetratricopeptide (TPR) repeat protein
VEDPETLAAAALGRGDYAQAAILYRKAIERRPDSVSAHYGLGVASSNLNLRDDTIREFQWVLAHGTPDSAEVDAARRWLIAAGVLRPSVGAATPAEVDRGGNGVIEGQAYLGSADQRQPQVRMQLHLVGQPDGPTKEERHVLRTDRDGSFRFGNVMPGSYMLTDRVAGKAQWRLKVEVGSGSTLRLDLSPGNSTATRDDFPNRG